MISVGGVVDVAGVVIAVGADVVALLVLVMWWCFFHRMCESPRTDRTMSPLDRPHGGPLT